MPLITVPFVAPIAPAFWFIRFLAPKRPKLVLGTARAWVGDMPNLRPPQPSRLGSPIAGPAPARKAAAIRNPALRCITNPPNKTNVVYYKRNASASSVKPQFADQ